MPAIAAALGLGVAAVVGLSVLSACAPGARRAQYRAQVHCAGQRYIEVRNGLVVPVDVHVASIPNSQGWQFLGTVRPGV